MTSYVTINGHTYSDAQDDGGSGIRFLGNGGHRTNLMLLVEDVILATDALNTDITALQLLKFLNATNRLAAIEYIDSTHTAVAHTFTSASIGQRGYDMDTKTFWDVRDVIDGVPTWTSGTTTVVINETVVGTAPTIVGSMHLASGNYSIPSAELGAGNPLYAATLELRKPDGTILSTIGGTAGGLAWRTAATGFTLTAPTDVDLVLYCNTPLEPAFLKGLTF